MSILMILLIDDMVVCWLLVGWLIGWLVDWLIGWLVDWLIDWLIDWLMMLMMLMMALMMLMMALMMMMMMMMMMMQNKYQPAVCRRVPGCKKETVTHPRRCLDFVESTKTTESFQLFTHKCGIYVWGHIVTYQTCFHMFSVCYMFQKKITLNFLQSNPSDHVEQLHKALLLVRVGVTQNRLPPNCLRKSTESTATEPFYRFFFRFPVECYKGIGEC